MDVVGIGYLTLHWKGMGDLFKLETLSRDNTTLSFVLWLEVNKKFWLQICNHLMYTAVFQWCINSIILETLWKFLVLV